MREICHLIYAYQEKQLNPEENRVFEEHLKNCPRCQEQLGILESLDLTLKETVGSVPPDLELSVRTRIIKKTEEKLERKRKKVSLLWRFGYSFSFAIVLIFSLIFSLYGEEALPSLPPAPLTLKEAGEAVSPTNAVDSQGDLRSTTFIQSQVFQGLLLVQAREEDLGNLRENFGAPYEGIGGARIYSFPDSSFETSIKDLEALKIFKINSPINSSFPLPEGDYLLVVQDPNLEKEKGFNLFLSAWKTEMKEVLSGWSLFPLFLALIFLGLSFFLKRRAFSFLFCLFLFVALILPSFINHSVKGYLYLGDPQRSLGNIPIAEESTEQYQRFYFSSLEKEEILDKGFFLGTEIPPIPQALESFNWGQENTFQILAFKDGRHLVLLILAIFLTKALVYLLPLVLFIFSQKDEGRVIVPVP